MGAKGLALVGMPSPKQAEFFSSTARHTAYGGARGGGKSWAMRRKFVLLALTQERLRLLLLRRTLPELRENHIRPLQIELAGIANYNETEKVFKFPNGSIIKLGYCDAENDVYQYQGQDSDVIGLEEATHFTESQMRFIATCNRSTRTDFTPRMYYTCNPGGVGHAWVKRLFIDKDYTEYENPDDYYFIQATLYDNKVLMEADPGYERQLLALPEDQRRAHLYGDWDVLEGQFFREWRANKHVCEPFNIPIEWRKFRAMDWGYNDPCCCLWFAIAPDKHIYVYNEYYKAQTLAVDVASTIKAKTGTAKIAYTASSPDMWQKRGVQIKPKIGEGFIGESIADVFNKTGVPLTPADNSRVLGWQRVREFLRDAPDGVPYLQVFNTCKNLIKYMPMLQYDEHNHEDAADGEDHAPEALRYGLMSRPSPSRVKHIENNIIAYDPFSPTKRRKAGGYLSI